jgi:hypothetical protein
MDLYNALRYWNDQPRGFPSLDQTDAEADREDSLSDRYAFQLGADLGLCRLEPPSQWSSDEMAKGYAHGRTREQKHADVYLRKLLRLRVNAYARGLPFSSAITTDYLREITVTVCPVSGAALTQGTLADTDWSVDRLDNGLGYVPGNICFMSTRVNAIKGTANFDDLLAAGSPSALLASRAALEQETSGGLCILEVFRVTSLVAAPASIARGADCRRFLPLAMAPGVWVSPECKLGGLHVACSRSRLETHGQRLRAALFKRLGKDVWRSSNKLVERVRSQMSSGIHPSDLWLDFGCASLLLELTDAFFQHPPPLPDGLDPEEVNEHVRSQFKTVSTYAR